MTAKTVENQYSLYEQARQEKNLDQLRIPVVTLPALPTNDVGSDNQSRALPIFCSIALC